MRAYRVARARECLCIVSIGVFFLLTMFWASITLESIDDSTHDTPYCGPSPSFVSSVLATLLIPILSLDDGNNGKERSMRGRMATIGHLSHARTEIEICEPLYAEEEVDEVQEEFNDGDSSSSSSLGGLGEGWLVLNGGSERQM